MNPTLIMMFLIHVCIYMQNLAENLKQITVFKTLGVSTVVPVFISSQNKRRKLTVHNGLKLKRHTSTARPRSMNKVTTT